MSESSRTPNYNPLDPFADNSISYDTHDIRNTKARETQRKVEQYKKQKALEAKRKAHKNRNSLLKRVKTFFKELPEREDRKKVYVRLVITPILVLAIGVAITISVIVSIDNRNHELKIEETKAEIESAHTNFFLEVLNEEEDLENYKLEIEEKYNSTDDPDLKFLYRKELIRLHIDNKEKNKEVIGWINEQLSYKKISTIDKVNLLVNLIALYRDNGMTNGLNNPLNELMNIPDDGEMTFGGETLSELKTRVKNENS